MTKTSELEDDMFLEILEEQDQVAKAKFLNKLRAKARELGRVKEFENLFKAWLQQYTQLKKQEHSNRTEFTDAPIVLNCGKYKANDTGIVSVDLTKNGDVLTSVACTHPIMITERYVNIDTDTEKAKIAFLRDGAWRSLVVDASQILNKSKVSDLADRGVIVTSESSKDLVKYFATIMDLNEKEIPLYKSISRLGWINQEFAPYVDEVKYDGDLDFLGTYQSIKEIGAFDIWKNHMEELRQKLEVRLVMAASFASALIEKVSALPFVLHLWGKTGGGKTVTLMVAASIWGNPEYGKLVRTMNMTANAMSRTASFLYNIPFCADELQQIKDRWGGNYDSLIMKICEGIDKGKAKAHGGIEELKTWKNAFILTGEEPITKANSGGGVKNRCIEIEIRDQIINDGHKTANIVKANYGFAGKMFVEHVKDKSVTEIQQDYKKIYDKIMQECDTTEKQAYSMSLLFLGDKYARECIFVHEEEIQISEIRRYLYSAKSVDPSERAWEWLMNWIAENNTNFVREGHQCYGILWGSINNDLTVMVNKSVLERCMNEQGFDFNSCKKDWASDGRLIKNPYNRYYHQTTVSCIKGIYIKLDFGEKKDFFEQIGDSDEFPFD